MNKNSLSLVSFSYDPRVKYGGHPPYNPEDNPAYNFVWGAVERLGLGTSDNPLKSIIKPGDTVLIKPNLVFHTQGTYTRPEVVRPIIDMVLAAGAKKIYIGDAGTSVPETDYTLIATHYIEMIRLLKRRNRGVDVRTINLNRLANGWRWINLGKYSSFFKSGYGNDELGFSRGNPLANQKYYRVDDSSGKNPRGKLRGWYAVSNVVFDSDVIINVPKMKTHNSMIATLSMKNVVGCTMASTYDEGKIRYLNLLRIPHCHVKNVNYFKNDVSGRALHDLNKMILYCDKNGRLKKTRQRKYLTVIDGIEAMEKSHHPIYGMGVPFMRHVVLAGSDPMATDMVACRVMGYDYRCIPAFQKTYNNTLHRIGDDNPKNIAIAGDCLDSRIKHVFEFHERWKNDAGSLAIQAFSPPKIRKLVKQKDKIIAHIDNCVAAYVMCDKQNILKMSKKEGAYLARLPHSANNTYVLAHDKHLNSITLRL